MSSGVQDAADRRRMSLDDSKRDDQLDTKQEGVTQGRCVWFCTREEPISESMSKGLALGLCLLSIRPYSLYQRTAFCPQGWVCPQDNNGTIGSS